MRTEPGSGNIVGIGLDLVDRARMEKIVLESSTTFRGHVFTNAEWTSCAAASDQVSALAICFAAKEACLKALGTGWAKGLTLQQVSLNQPERPNPRVELSGAAAERANELGVHAIHVAVSRLANVVAVLVVMTQ